MRTSTRFVVGEKPTRLSFERKNPCYLFVRLAFEHAVFSKMVNDKYLGHPPTHAKRRADSKSSMAVAGRWDCAVMSCKTVSCTFLECGCRCARAANARTFSRRRLLASCNWAANTAYRLMRSLGQCCFRKWKVCHKVRSAIGENQDIQCAQPSMRS
jgi:hypothetical protein